MKKLTYLTAFLLITCLVSCKKDNVTKPVPQQAKTQLSNSRVYNYQQAIIAKRTSNSN